MTSKLSMALISRTIHNTPTCMSPTGKTILGGLIATAVVSASSAPVPPYRSSTRRRTASICLLTLVLGFSPPLAIAWPSSILKTPELYD